MSDFLIGDISGYKKEFEELIKDKPWITRIVALGDIIDRGPDSKGLIEFFKNNPQHACLMGNHEHMMIKSYEEVIEGKKNPYNLIFWIYINGGKQTLESYGIEVPDLGYSRDEIKSMNSQLKKTLLESPEVLKLKQDFNLIPKDHIDFLKSLPMFIETDCAFYSHASVSVWNQPKMFEYKAFEGNDYLLDMGCLWSRSITKKPRPDHKYYVYGHQNKDRVLVHSKKYPMGKYLDPNETHLSKDSWGACIDTVKAGYLTGLKIDDLSVYYSSLLVK
jgi:hypothetical protein